MKEKEKLDALVHLIQLLNLAEPPTLRESGISIPLADELSQAGLIQLGCRDGALFPNELDRYYVLEVTTTGKSWVLLNHERINAEAHRKPLVSKIREEMGSRLWDFLWDALKVAAGVLIGWYLATRFGIKAD